MTAPSLAPLQLSSYAFRFIRRYKVSREDVTSFGLAESFWLTMLANDNETLLTGVEFPC